MTKASIRDVTDLLHSLGYLYARHGQERRGLVLLLIASQVAEDDVGVLKTLAATFIAMGQGRRALAALDRVEALGGDEPTLELLRSRAFWAEGEDVEARRAFRGYVDSRRTA
jgi:type III secretion protein Y